MSKPKIKKVRQLDFYDAANYFVDTGKITREELNVFVDKYLLYPSNGSTRDFCPAEAKACLDEDYYPEEVKKVLRVFVEEYGMKDYEFHIWW